MTRKAWFDFCSDTSAAIVEDSHFHQVMSDPWEAVVVRLHHQNGVPSTIRPLGFHQAGFNGGHITSNGSMELLRLFKRIVGTAPGATGRFVNFSINLTETRMDISRRALHLFWTMNVRVQPMK